MTKPAARCPKCRSTTLLITEVYASEMYFGQENGVIDPVSEDTDGGSVIGIHCKCRECGHAWTPRGVYHVTGFAGYPERCAPPPPLSAGTHDKEKIK